MTERKERDRERERKRERERERERASSMGQNLCLMQTLDRYSGLLLLFKPRNQKY